MKKSFSVFFLVFFLILVLAGCGAKPVSKNEVPIAPKQEAVQNKPVSAVETPATKNIASDEPQAKAFAKGNPYAVDVSPTQAYKNPFSK